MLQQKVTYCLSRLDIELSELLHKFIKDIMNLTLINKKAQRDAASTLSTTDRQSQKSGNFLNSKPLATSHKKQNPITQFINETLSGWPLWVKLTSSNQKNTETLNSKSPEFGRKVTVTEIEDINHYIFSGHVSRSGHGIIMKYLHWSPDGMTYFFLVFSQKAYEYEHQHGFAQVKQIPKQFEDIIYKMPTEKAKKQLEKYVKKRFLFF